MPLSPDRRKDRRVIVIGFDGATLDLVRPWAEEGVLPTFGRLMTQGAWGPLRSIMPPVTPAAWSSFATGMNPGKHGVFDFTGRKHGSYETYVVDASHRDGVALWQLLSQAGYRVTVFNIPATYPPDPVNGLMVSGLLTPPRATDATWPSQLQIELMRAVPDFNFYPPIIYSRGQDVEFVESVTDFSKASFKAARYLMEREPWDCFVTVFIGTDIIQHFMWRHMGIQRPSVLADDPVSAEFLSNAIKNSYRDADNVLAELLQAAGDDVYVVIMSDHGFGPLDHYMHLNAWLVEKGYLKFKHKPSTLVKYLAYRTGLAPLRIIEGLRALRQGERMQKAAREHNVRLKELVGRFFLSLGDIDWSRTTAYSMGFGGRIFINVRGREPQGTVEPGAECEALVNRLIGDLRSMIHPHTGEPFVGKIYRREELYAGPHTADTADLLFEPRDWRNQSYGINEFASNRWLEPSPDRTGTHRMNGLLFVSGPGIRPAYRFEDASIMDVAPTILALMGVPIPKNMDGRVLSGAFTDELASQLTITYACEPEDISKRVPPPDISDEDDEIIRRHLRGVGYIV